MIHIGVWNAILSDCHCFILVGKIVDIYTIRFYLLVLVCNRRSCQRSCWLLAAPCHWLFVSVVVWLGAVSQSQASLKWGLSWLEPWSLSAMYGPLRLTHKHSQGILMKVLDGKCPYLSFHLLLVWQVLPDPVIDRIVVHTPFQYIVAFIVSLRRICLGCW